MQLPLASLTVLALVGTAGPGTETTARDADPHAIVQGELGTELDGWLERMERFGFHGAVLVAGREEILLQKGYGLAHRESRRPITSQTLFDLGSLGKQFVATAVLLLAAEGKLDLEAPIGTYLENVPEDKRAITAHHLLSHTAGFPYMPGPGSPLELPLQSAPGERWSYSNPGYSLLALLVEATAGQGFEAYVREHLFAAAGLEQTRFRGDPGHPADCAYAYTDETEQGSAGEPGGLPEMFRGAGGVTSCVGDLWKWEQVLRSHTLLSEEWTERLFTEHARNPGASTGYAYGWMTAQTERGTRVVFHGGNLGGFNTELRRYLDEGWTIAFLSNHFVNGRSQRDAIVNDLSRLLNGGKVAEPPAAIELEPEALAGFAGEYRSEDGLRLSVATDGRDLLVRGHDPQAVTLVFAPWSEEEDPQAARTKRFIEESDALALEILAGIHAGEAGPLQANISPSLPWGPAWSGFQSRAASMEASLGPVVRCQSLGTAPAGSPVSGRTLVRVERERGEELRSITWAGGRLIHLTTVSEPPALRFAPLTPNRFASYDLFTRRSTHVVFGGEPGEAPTLRIATPTGARAFTRL